jgi:hypothetical protein
MDVTTSGYSPKYEKVEDLSNVRKLWDAQIEKTPKTHTKHTHLITGAILPVWDRLTGETRIYRTQFEDGTRLIGRLIPEKQLKQTLKQLGAEGEKILLTPEEVIAGVAQGNIYTLANGWKLKQRRVSNENRMEITGPNLAEREEIKKDGVIEELISYQTRYFVPSGENGPAVLKKITEYRPVVDEQKVDLEETSLSMGMGVGGVGISRDRVLKAILPVVKKWKSRPAIKVIATMLDAPEKVVAYAKSRGADRPGRGPRGFVDDDGTVYLVAENINSEAQARITLAHETVGHASMEDMLGKEFPDLLYRVQALKALKDPVVLNLAAEVDARYNRPDKPKLGPDREAQEIIAVAAERRITEGKMGRLLRKARELMRRALLAMGLKDAFSSTDLDILISEAGRRLTTGKFRRATRPEPAFSMPGDSPEVPRKQNRLVDSIRAGQPLDRVFRAPLWWGIDKDRNVFRPTERIYDKLAEVVNDTEFNPEGKMAWMNGFLQSARAGLIDRHGLPEEYRKRDMKRESDQRRVLLEAVDLIDDMKARGVDQSRKSRMPTGRAFPSPSARPLTKWARRRCCTASFPRPPTSATRAPTCTGSTRSTRTGPAGSESSSITPSTSAASPWWATSSRAGAWICVPSRCRSC